MTAVSVQILLARADQDYPRDRPPPLRFIRSCSSALAASTLHKLEAAFKAPVLEVCLPQCSLFDSCGTHLWLQGVYRPQPESLVPQ